MVTKEKVTLLGQWIMVYQPEIEKEHGLFASHLSCGFAGIVINNLPDNSPLFTMPKKDAINKLLDIVNDYSDKLSTKLDSHS